MNRDPESESRSRALDCNGKAVVQLNLCVCGSDNTCARGSNKRIGKRESVLLPPRRAWEMHVILDVTGNTSAGVEIRN